MGNGGQADGEGLTVLLHAVGELELVGCGSDVLPADHHVKVGPAPGARLYGVGSVSCITGYASARLALGRADRAGESCGTVSAGVGQFFDLLRQALVGLVELTAGFADLLDFEAFDGFA
ncbi:hypothetical protein [Streptomyces sp. NWU339]|uniref:hypothetical protein n=1 Tax=Streptomyces sp. NWU339 TaxID=2185284 RepID=UPI0011B5F4CA|nr:hypothetical protein [Streptomyces sp. NWU339]